MPSRLSLGLRYLRGIASLVFHPRFSRTYFPEQPRKGKVRVALELLRGLVRARDLNSYYYVYGLDRKDGVKTDDYLSYKEFRRIRDSRNKRPQGQPACDYRCLLRDKFIFSQLAGSLSIPCSVNLALCSGVSVSWLPGLDSTTWDEIAFDHEKKFDGFCKPLSGINGRGAFPLALREGRFFLGEEEISPSELKEKVTGKCVLQDRIRQHRTMESLHPASVNTIRLITFNNEGNVELFSAAQRIGTKDRGLDNWTAGGILVGINPTTGRLKKTGFYKPGYGGRVERHPQSGIIFSGFQIPFFDSAVQVVKKFHSYLDGIHSIGWDVAITETGPVVVEGNDDWDGAVPMALEEGFKQRFLRMYQ